MKVIDLISLVDVTLSKRSMILEWNNIVTIINGFRKHDPLAFVIDIHQWLRQTKGAKYQASYWNFFLTLTAETDCNCLCSSLFILLCCYQIGLFGRYILGAATAEHILLINKEQNAVFETTTTCRTNWESIESYKKYVKLKDNERFPVIDNDIKLLSTIVINVEELYKGRHKVQLLRIYPFYQHPKYIAILFGLTLDFNLINIMIGMEQHNTVASCASDFLIVMQFITVRFTITTKIEQILHALYDMLLRAKANNPDNVKVIKAVASADILFGR